MEAIDACANIFALLIQDSRKNRISTGPKHAIDLRQEFVNDLCSQVTQNQVNRPALQRVNGSTKCPDFMLGVPTDVRLGNIDGNGIDVAGEYAVCAEKSGSNGEYSRTCSEIQNLVMRLD